MAATNVGLEAHLEVLIQQQQQLIGLLTKQYGEDGEKVEAKTFQEKLKVSPQGVLQPCIWVKAFSAGILIMAWPSVVGAVFFGEDFEMNFEDYKETYMWATVRGPLIPVVLVTMMLSDMLGFRIGGDLLAESSSSGVSMKEAISSMCGNTATVASLFLGFTLAMLQVGSPDPPGDDLTVAGAMDVRSMWYTIYLHLASLLCLSAVMCSSFMIYYMSPLSDDAVLQFCLDNMNYLGSPLACIGLAVTYTCCALQIWLFQAINDQAVCFILLYPTAALGVIIMIGRWRYIAAWQNTVDGPKDEEERAYRANLAKQAQGVNDKVVSSK
eukprot:gnl/TRDRNA2_/TRDRNA2_66401_c0_seq2.p1 gnl/TRDRNA2_/TRDRNA2_66401_c0~~gnl/TRDRNA2_/TRDRNA2_66401_c0_seq2.p1  ORF type:complete len:325 (-),score=45.66 gnl/TRDRNA2_/TRDRNA2_66401_c0_seq2:109-1083(-)